MFWLVSAIVFVPAIFEVYGFIVVKEKKALGISLIAFGFLAHLIGSIIIAFIV